MIARLVLAIAALVVLGSPSFAQSLAPRSVVSMGVHATPAVLRAAHLAQVERMKCGDAQASYYREADEWHHIDLDGDGSDEYVVFLTLEGFGGGNNYSRYLVVYRYVEPVWFASTVLLVGGKGDASVSGHVLRLSGADLSTDAMFYGPQDPTCCASVPGRVNFEIGVGGALEPIEHPRTDQAAAYRFMLMFSARCNQ